MRKTGRGKSYGKRTYGASRSYRAPSRPARQNNRSFNRGLATGMITSTMMSRRRRRPFIMGRRHRRGGCGCLVSFIIMLILLYILFNLLF